MRGLRGRKYLVLFLTAVFLLAVQPLAHRLFAGVLLRDALLTLVACLAAGQFYVAVGVAQFVGLKLARPPAGKRRGNVRGLAAPG
jgi:hypothetical protein